MLPLGFDHPIGRLHGLSLSGLGEGGGCLSGRTKCPKSLAQATFIRFFRVMEAANTKANFFTHHRRENKEQERCINHEAFYESIDPSSELTEANIGRL